MNPITPPPCVYIIKIFTKASNKYDICLQPLYLNLYATHVVTNHKLRMLHDYKLKFTKNLKTTPRATLATPTHNTLHAHHPLKYEPQMCIYTNGSFIPLDESGIGNIASSGVYIPHAYLHIAKWLPKLQNILWAELNAIVITATATKHFPHDIFILVDSLINIYLRNNHIRYPSFQHHHLDKLLIVAIVNQIR